MSTLRTTGSFDDPVFRLSQAALGFVLAKQRFEAADRAAAERRGFRPSAQRHVYVKPRRVGTRAAAADGERLLASYVIPVTMGASEADTELNNRTIPLTETMWWARSLDEGLEDLIGAQYRQARRDEPDAAVIVGLTYARNQTGHQRVLPIEKAQVHLSLIVFAVETYQVVWRPLEHLPSGRSRAQAVAYKQALAARTVASTLERAEQWFIGAVRRWAPALKSMSWPQV